MKLLVSIHDVSPAHESEVEQLWSICARRGISPALLVVPDWHGEWPIEDSPDFVRWVRDRAAAGADILLHGERHDEFGLRRTTADELRAFGRTDYEGEFLTLDQSAARERIERGIARLRALGLPPVGFVAPAWLERKEGRRAIGAAGLAVSEDAEAIYLHRRASRLESPVLRWSARTAWRANASAFVAAVARWRYRRHWLLRIAFHPKDLSHPATARSLEATIDSLISGRTAWSYAAL